MCLVACYSGQVKYIGLDVHQASTTFCIRSAHGRILATGTVPTTKHDIVAAIRSVRGPVAVTFEEGHAAAWLHGILKRHARRVIACDPRHNVMLRDGSKSDRIDAAKLSELLRLGAVRPVYHGDAGSEALRVYLHDYDALRTDVIRVKLRLRAVFRSVGKHIQGTAFFNPRHRTRFLRMLSRMPAQHSRADMLFRQLDMTLGLLAEARSRFLAEASTRPAFVLLQSIPYIGEIRAAVLVAAIITPARFRNRGCFWSYGGLAVRVHSTNDFKFANGRPAPAAVEQPTRGLTQRFHRPLRRTLRQISVSAAAGRGPLRAIFDRAVSRGLCRSVARTLLARKIAGIILAVWREGRPFDPLLLHG
jgi:transposase